MPTTSQTPAPNLVLTRTYNAPRARVFKAWTNPEQLAQWWGPHGFTTPVCRADAQPGGVLYLEMCGPAGSIYEAPYPMYGAFVEVVEPEKLVFTSSLKNTDGTTFLENINTVILTESNGKTTMTLHVQTVIAGPGSADPLSGMTEGWNQSLERLEAFVQSA